MSANFLDPDHLLLEEGEDVDSILVCSICQGILIDPKECRVCQRSFCSKCLTKWKLNSDLCPNQCKVSSFTTSHLMVRNSLSKLKFRCFNKSCEMILFYKDKLNSKHENACAAANDSTLMKLNENTRFVIQCTFCNKRMGLREIQEHELECTEQTRKVKETIENCSFCCSPTNKYEECSLCREVFCEKRCMAECNQCAVKFCVKQCSSICFCLKKVYCVTCSASMHENEGHCEICSMKYVIKCENCALKSICNTCQKKVCVSCSLFCSTCGKNSCSECMWTCVDCNFRKCQCETQFNSYKYAIVSIFYGAYFFAKPSDFHKWSVLFKILYVIGAFIVIFPITLCILVIYLALGIFLLEFARGICKRCKDLAFDSG